MRRNHLPFGGNRYVGDKRTRIVHDLDREDGTFRGCGIDRIPLADVVTFEPDILHEAHRQGYRFCGTCIGGNA